MASFRHGRVLFAGDSAHQVSPFGARGANSGIQDVDSLGWKPNAVIDGVAPETLLDSYSDERGFAADENLLNSTRLTDFITPRAPSRRCSATPCSGGRAAMPSRARWSTRGGGRSTMRPS